MKTKANTNPMKNIFLLLLLFTAMAEAQIVNIPDAIFKAKLLSAEADSTNSLNLFAKDALDHYIKIDANSDGEIQESEAAAIYYLQVQYSNISDLTGIASFTNLRQLACGNNALTTVDFTSLNNLLSLSCYGNQIAILNVNNLTNLSSLECSGNLLTQLEVGNLTNLISLNCSGNQLTSIDVSSLVNLQEFSCGGNLLTQLDMSSLVGLRGLNCSGNLLTSLDFSGLHALYGITCGNNPLTSINLHDLTGLSEFNCQHTPLTSMHFSGTSWLEIFTINDNQLTDLTFDDFRLITIFDASNNQIQDLDFSHVFFANSTDLDISVLYTGNPLRTLNMKNGRLDGMEAYNAMNDIDTWEFICGDDISYEVSLIQTNRPGVVVNSYCSFIPGGNFNTINGHVTYDADNNGCDGNDVLHPNIKLNINDGTNQGATFINAAGQYSFYTQTGSFDISPSFENPSWFTFSPSTVTIPFLNENNNTVIQDFCVTTNGTHPDIEVVIVPITPARPGFDAQYQIVYKNKGNQVLSGNITFTYDDTVLDFVNATVNPNTQNSGLLNWNYADLLTFEDRSFYITLNVNSPLEAPAVNVGDILQYQATITPVIGDEVPEDNLFSFNQTVVGSFDPNDITCIEGAVVPPSEIGNYLHYVINFENTGTFPAESIVVKTEVDASKFDIGSLQLMNSNFPVYARITGNKVEFIYENIQLPIGGHGHILLKIKTKNSLVTGDAVAKRADIFFDYNAPVDTGFANTVFQTLSNTDFEIDNSVVVSPNPAAHEITVKADNNIKSIQLYDVQGRIIMTSLIDESESKLQISNYSNGIYFIKITTEKGIKVQKLLKK